jgi:putative membrane protein
VLRIDEGRSGSYIGILIIATAFVAVLSGIAAYTGWRSALAATAGVMAIGGGAEILGLYARLPFGRYEYTDWWLPYVTLPGGKLFPLLLPVTWFLMVALWYLLLARRFSGWPLILGTGLLAALTDLVLEPVITRVVLFWRWLEPTPLLGAPYLNFPGWLVTASLAAGCLHGFRIGRARGLPHPLWMVPAGLFFTAVIGVAYGEPRGALALLLIPPAVWLGTRA